MTTVKTRHFYSMKKENTGCKDGEIEQREIKSSYDAYSIVPQN